MKNICYFLFVCMIISASMANGQNFTNIKVNNITSGDQNTDGGNSVAVHNNNVYLLWQDMGSTFFSYVSKSTDGGSTFSNGVKVGGNDPHVFGAITVDNSGTIYAAWDGIAGEMPNGVYLSKSTDQAATFSAPVTVSSDGLFPQVRVFGSNVYILFCKAKTNNKVGYFFARSTNGGTTFEAPYEITDVTIDDVKYDTPDAMFVDNSGNIYCVWNDGRRTGTGTDIYMAKSTNNGTSFSANVLVNDPAGSADKIRTGAAIAAVGSNIYVIWRQEDDDHGANRKILFSKSANGGTSFGAEKEIAFGGSGSPALTVNSAGEIYIAYPQYSVQQNGVFCAKSNDQGASFPVTTFISGANADAKNPSIFVDAGDALYAVWTDVRSGNDDVYFAKGTITITDIAEEENIIPAQYELMQNYPNPFNPTTIIKYSIPQSQYVNLKVYDLLGREVISLIDEEVNAGSYEVELDGSSLTSGIYFYRLQSGTYSETKKLILMK